VKNEQKKLFNDDSKQGKKMITSGANGWTKATKFRPNRKIHVNFSDILEIFT